MPGMNVVFRFVEVDVLQHTQILYETYEQAIYDLQSEVVSHGKYMEPNELESTSGFEL